MHHSAICQFEANNKALVEPLHKKIWLVLPWCCLSLWLHCRGTSTVHPTAGTGLLVPTYLNTSIARLCMYLPCLLFMFLHSFCRSCFSLFAFVKKKTFQEQFVHHEEGKQKHICFSRYHTGLSAAHIADQLFHTIRSMIETISPTLMNSMCN